MQACLLGSLRQPGSGCSCRGCPANRGEWRQSVPALLSAPELESRPGCPSLRAHRQEC